MIHLHMLIRRMDAHLGLNLKTVRQYREGLHKLIIKGPVAGHNVLNVRIEEAVNAVLYKGIAEIMEGPLIFCVISG